MPVFTVEFVGRESVERITADKYDVLPRGELAFYVRAPDGPQDGKHWYHTQTIARDQWERVYISG